MDEQRLRHGQQPADCIKLLAFYGSRRNETLRRRSSDGDWDRKQMTIGTDGMSKNREHRMVDFKPKLEAHGQAMLPRRAPDSNWLFPSPPPAG